MLQSLLSTLSKYEFKLLIGGPHVVNRHVRVRVCVCVHVPTRLRVGAWGYWEEESLVQSLPGAV